MDNTPSTLEGNIGSSTLLNTKLFSTHIKQLFVSDGKLSSGGTRIKKFLEFRAAGGDLENFDQTPKKSKTGKKLSTYRLIVSYAFLTISFCFSILWYKVETEKHKDF